MTDTREIEARLRELAPTTCDSECLGRCRICPQQLMEAAADALAAMRWILVAERLPEIGQLITAHYAAKDTYWTGRYHHKMSPSAWMPLPAAPKE